MTDLIILGGGAVHGLVKAVAPRFDADFGCSVSGTFGAVGAMRAKLAAGERADVAILTAAIMRELAEQGLVDPASLVPVGEVPTALAARAGDQPLRVDDGNDLRRALLDADAVFLPDPRQATAGIHFAGVIGRLGIADTIAPRLRAYPNGAAAMAALAASSDIRPLGCTQATEILATPGVQLIGNLPDGYELMTTYTAGIAGVSANPQVARDFIRSLAAPEARELRIQCGFAVPLA